MLRAEDRIRKLTAITSVMLMAAAEALAQENLARPVRRIVVSIPDRKLAVMEAGRVVKIFAAAVGAPESPSPSGVYKIVTSIPDPTWYGKGKVIGPGRNNPIGTRWLGLDLKGYGIHGTNNPASIGHSVSHGCVRLRNHDIEELSGMVRIGDQVELYAGRNSELDRIFGETAVAQGRTEAGSGAAQ